MSTDGDIEATSAAEPNSAGARVARFQVDDMTCTHCEKTILDALTTGMPEAQCVVDLASHTVTVTVTGNPAQAEAIIRDAGYEPKLLAL